LLLNNNDVHGFISKGVILAKVIIKDCNINPLSWIFINIKCCFKIPFRVVIIFYCLWLCFLLSICQFYIRISFSKFALLFNILCFNFCFIFFGCFRFLNNLFDNFGILNLNCFTYFGFYLFLIFFKWLWINRLGNIFTFLNWC